MTPPNICRRCGEPRDESHVPAPYLCKWNPEKVRAVFQRAQMHVVPPPKEATPDVQD